MIVAPKEYPTMAQMLSRVETSHWVILAAERAAGFKQPAARSYAGGALRSPATWTTTRRSRCTAPGSPAGARRC
jgi:hypothetical protein